MQKMSAIKHLTGAGGIAKAARCCRTLNIKGRIVPFTPFHMGSGIAIKAVLQGSFSLLVFGWTQIVMDIQPLIVLLSGVINMLKDTPNIMRCIYSKLLVL